MSLTIIAFGVSLPDVIASLIVVREGKIVNLVDFIATLNFINKLQYVQMVP